MNNIINSDCINLIYSFVNDYKKLHKKNMKIILRAIKKYNIDYHIKPTMRELACDGKLRYCYDYKKKYIKIYKKKYDYNFLRRYLPYEILINSKTNEYFLLNRDYKNIITNKHSNGPIGFSSTGGGWLFNDGTTIWTKNMRENEKNLREIQNKFKELTKNKKCLNYNYHTFNILNLNI